MNTVQKHLLRLSGVKELNKFFLSATANQEYVVLNFLKKIRNVKQGGIIEEEEFTLEEINKYFPAKLEQDLNTYILYFEPTDKKQLDIVYKYSLNGEELQPLINQSHIEDMKKKLQKKKDNVIALEAQADIVKEIVEKEQEALDKLKADKKKMEAEIESLPSVD
jgi:isochorismate synthase EntC